MQTLATLSASKMGKPFAVAPDVYGMQTVMVNVYFVGTPQRWVLVDAGLYFCADRIRRAAGEIFGKGARPAAILLTHGHFDHVGSLAELARGWNAPVYAHRMEMPYLTGRSSYPPPDFGAGGGSMAYMAPLYPRGPIDVSDVVRVLPDGGSVPEMPDWRVVYTPGHTPGHVSFFRESDRTLLAGDAFVTTRQESLTAILSQRKRIHGPPAYFTPDWESAEASVQKLADLDPETAACGHGIPMQGEPLRRGLRNLAQDFRARAVPRWGRYVGRPARADERGVIWAPPPTLTPAYALAGVVGVAAAALLVSRRR